MPSKQNLIGSIAVEVACAHVSSTMMSLSHCGGREKMDKNTVAEEVHCGAAKHALSMLGRIFNAMQKESEMYSPSWKYCAAVRLRSSSTLFAKYQCCVARALNSIATGAAIVAAATTILHKMTQRWWLARLVLLMLAVTRPL